MFRRSEIQAKTVNTLRAARLAGARATTLVAELLSRGYEPPEVSDHLIAAFQVGALFGLRMVPADRPDLVDRLAEAAIDAARDRWSTAPPFPDLLRRRDRQAFQLTAAHNDCIFIVAAAHPAAARHVGQALVRPYPLPGEATVGSAANNAGLVIADPADTRHSARLQARGLHIGTADEGHAVQGPGGVRFHPAYRLLGAYRHEGARDAWTGHDGERLRWELNGRMGLAMLPFGPDDSADALDRAYEGPSLLFLPSGNVTVHADRASLAAHYDLLGLRARGQA
jgi:hypothetical protein